MEPAARTQNMTHAASPRSETFRLRLEVQARARNKRQRDTIGLRVWQRSTSVSLLLDIRQFSANETILSVYVYTAFISDIATLNAEKPCLAEEACARRASRTDRTTRMLLAVLGLFLSTEVPQGLLGLASALAPEFFQKCYSMFVQVLSRRVVNQSTRAALTPSPAPAAGDAPCREYAGAAISYCTTRATQGMKRVLRVIISN
ncbi:hypothetical protein EVAR_31023_1 [Eumeta japonica]|uniref:Uncharacterized protein n=1 Tax=Eumeta variegata TaxID=151549 RepID=A0A4C1VH15_EUMVA|nr:hypothetical protein EVAR_31023_1 [Eumeta japonica]